MKNWLSFWLGFGSILDIFGFTSPSPKVQLGDFSDDAEALRSDWEKVAQDFNDVSGFKP